MLLLSSIQLNPKRREKAVERRAVENKKDDCEDVPDHYVDNEKEGLVESAFRVY